MPGGTNCARMPDSRSVPITSDRGRLMPFIYDPGQGRTKHRWNKDYAGFVSSGRGYVGKCPNTMALEKAQELLDTGFPVYDEDQYPEYVFNVFGGVVYVAVHTEPGKSYHGYPWRGDRGMGPGIPEYVRKELAKRAAEQGESREFTKWMKLYGG